MFLPESLGLRMRGMKEPRTKSCQNGREDHPIGLFQQKQLLSCQIAKKSRKIRKSNWAEEQYECRTLLSSPPNKSRNSANAASRSCGVTSPSSAAASNASTPSSFLRAN